MASGQTPQYLLNQWVKSDQVLMEEFNADNLKLDTALAGLAAQVAAKAENSDLTALTAQVAGKAAATDLTALAAKVEAKAEADDLTELAEQVAGKAEQTALDTLSAQVATKAAASTLSSLQNRTPRLLTGVYTGDGTETRTIALGYTPSAIFVCRNNGAVYLASGYSFHYGGLAFPGKPCLADDGTTKVVTIISGGFQVGYMDDDLLHVHSNAANKSYFYITLDYPG